MNCRRLCGCDVGETKRIENCIRQTEISGNARSAPFMSEITKTREMLRGTVVLNGRSYIQYTCNTKS